MKIERTEYPRPYFKREEWLMLNGEWEFAYDDSRKGELYGWHLGKMPLERKIQVPFSYQYEASGIGDDSIHEVVWYKRSFTIDSVDKRALLCFNGADYQTDVWINGIHVISHMGGFSPFQTDITSYLVVGCNIIVVKCVDELDESIPRGKQSFIEGGKQFGCWYTPNTGIWQSVWIDFCGMDNIENYSIIPDVDNGMVRGQIRTATAQADTLQVTVRFKNEDMWEGSFSIHSKKAEYALDVKAKKQVDKLWLWNTDCPNLYDIEFVLLKNDEIVDKTVSRFGMRKISVENGIVYLNNSPIYQRLVLDQGYWKESGITAPNIESLKEDIKYTKAMGFNGARKHQKFEDPYYYYFAEEEGLLVWCEMPSAYDFCEKEVNAVTREWQEILSVAKNYTCVIAYVPLNESWGCRLIATDKQQQDFARAMYYITKSIDQTRLISTNDGWENVCPTDFITIHDYAYDDRYFDKRYVDTSKYDTLSVANRKVFSSGNVYQGQPIIFSEFGGVMLQKNEGGVNWGYGESAKSENEFYLRIKKLVYGINRCPFQGYCYTQITDVQQEKNGLLDENHVPKFPIEKLREIFEIIIS